jgi:hypothetical protein
MTCSLNTVFVLTCQRRTRKSYKAGTGEQGSATQYQEFNWKFAPLVYPESSHPIVKNLGGIKFDFANPIDTLKNGIKKTILLNPPNIQKNWRTSRN